MQDSGYYIWVGENRDSYTTKNPNMPEADLIRLMAKSWRNQADCGKKPYIDAAKSYYEAYKKEEDLEKEIENSSRNDSSKLFEQVNTGDLGNLISGTTKSRPNITPQKNITGEFSAWDRRRDTKDASKNWWDEYNKTAEGEDQNTAASKFCTPSFNIGQTKSSSAFCFSNKRPRSEGQRLVTPQRKNIKLDPGAMNFSDSLDATGGFGRRSCEDRFSDHEGLKDSGYNTSTNFENFGLHRFGV